MDNKKEWFSEWFDSPYYHMLYRNRDYSEAEFFLSNLIHYFNAQKDRKIIDLACGKGRHAIYLNSLGYNVTGVDLAANSIEEANQSANENLHFEVQDLRDLRFKEEFDIALNLFTSFGYFKSKEEDILVIKNINKILKPGGFVLIDFMNSEVVIQKLIEHESKHICDIQFSISKRVENDFIVKQISFSDNKMDYEFTEKVQALTIDDFEQMLTSEGFNMIKIFGNYALEDFKRGTSERLIIVAQKNV
jgi:SAM-dependent methyltransferase